MRMPSIARSVLGFAILLNSFAACSGSNGNDGSDDHLACSGGENNTDNNQSSGGEHPSSGGTGNTGNETGSGGESPSSGGDTGIPTKDVPLTMSNGWIDAEGNVLGIQGAVFHYADDTTLAGPPEMTATKEATGEVGKYCIAGEAAKIDTACTLTAEDMAKGANDCYDKYWGAAIGFNLNQPINETANDSADPEPYDASALAGFGFTISGSEVPSSLRFKVEDTNGEFCTGPEVGITPSPQTIKFDQLFKQCWYTVASGNRGPVVDDAAKSGLVKIAWQVVTNASGSIPFDFCVSDIIAVLN